MKLAGTPVPVEASELVRARDQLIRKVGVGLQHKVVRVGDVRTTYYEAGTGDPLVLLHGAAAGGLYWFPVIGSLAQRFRVVVPDMVGYGESDKPRATYDRPYYVSWLGHFLDAVATPRVHLVGLSQGGAIAVGFAQDAPDRVERLVLVSPAGLGRRVAPGYLLGYLLLNLFPTPQAHRWLRKYVVARPGSYDVDLAAYQLQVQAMAGGSRPCWQGRGRVVARFEVGLLSRLCSDTLVVWGERDRVFRRDDPDSSAAIPTSRRVVIPEAGHTVFFDQPAAFLEVLTEFLMKPTVTANGPGEHSAAS